MILCIISFISLETELLAQINCTTYPVVNTCGGLANGGNICRHVSCGELGQPGYYSFTDCAPVINGTVCLPGFVNQNGCSVSYSYDEGGVTFNGMSFVVRKKMPPVINFAGTTMNYNLVYVDPPYNSYYNYPTDRKLLCLATNPALNFNGWTSPGQCITLEVFRQSYNHDYGMVGLPVYTQEIPAGGIYDLSAMVTVLKSLFTCNDPLVIRLRIHCCGTNTYPPEAMFTKYIFIRVTENVPTLDFQFLTNPFTADNLVFSPGETNQSDGLENLSYNENAPVILGPSSCGAYFPNYLNTTCIRNISFYIHQKDLTNQTWGLKFSASYPVNMLPAQLGFNGLDIIGFGTDYFSINKTILYGIPFRFTMIAEGGCGATTKIAYFTFAANVKGLTKSDEDINSKLDHESVSVRIRESSYEYQISPNPAQDKISILTKDPYFECEILNTTGIKLKTFKQEQADISDLKSGLYFIIIKSSNDVVKTLKFIKN